MGKRSKKPLIGVALGSGSARGWAHIGILKALERYGIKPDIVCGTSIGALVGGAYAAGVIDKFEKWVLSLDLKKVLSFLDISFYGGIFKGEKLIDFYRDNFADKKIEDLPLLFGAVATSLTNGSEVWIKKGFLVDAVRASISLPGFFTPYIYEDMLLVDGGLVNPVPVSLARAMGADIVIAVDLGVDKINNKDKRLLPAIGINTGKVGEWLHKMKERFNINGSKEKSENTDLPTLIEVLTTSIHIMQVRISRSRLAGDPPDLLIAPKLGHFSLFDFHLGKEAIEEGEKAVERVESQLLDIKQLVY
ncbi:MAG: patatin-like phospholipase RssA [Deferribacterales bacterium]